MLEEVLTPVSYHDSYSPRQWLLNALLHVDKKMAQSVRFDDDYRAGLDAISILHAAMGRL